MTESQMYVAWYEGLVAAGKKPRQKLKYALMRVSLPGHDFVKPIKRLFGGAAKAALYETYIAMSWAQDGVISKETILAIIDENGVQKIDEFFDYCADKGLIQVEMHGFSNSVVMEDQESYAKKLYDSALEAVRKLLSRGGGQSKDIPNENPSKVVSGSSGSPVSVSDLSINLKELDTRPVRKALELFSAKIAQSGRALDQLTLDAMVMSYAGRLDDFYAALMYSASLTKTKNLIAPDAKNRAQYRHPVVRVVVHKPTEKEPAKPATETELKERRELSENLAKKIAESKSSFENRVKPRKRL